MKSSIIASIISILVLFSCALLTFCSKSDSEEAQVKTVTYLNHSPDVKYTGIQSCTPCHQEIHHEFLETGKGKSFYQPSIDNIIEDFSNVKVYDRHTDLYYTAFWRGAKMYISEYRLAGVDTTHQRTEQVNFVIGSGNQTRSYLFEKNGYFYEMPITWYVGKKIWDLSPGYENGNNSGFSRTIGQQCMECHNSGNDFVKHSVNKFLSVGSGLSCEKCHGPGELHIKKMQGIKTKLTANQIDSTIVNPAKLPVQLQFDVCRQCHLEGITVPKQGKDPFDFKPGMALTDFWDVFLPVAKDQTQFGFASHAERLQLSKCFIKSNNKLTCVTCHDSHKSLKAKSIETYNQKCLSCHKPKECGESHQLMVQAGNNCIKCHMPKSGTTDIPHVSSTDHFIRKLSADEQRSTSAGQGIVVFKSFTDEKSSQEPDRANLIANMVYFEQIDRDQVYLDRIKQYVGKLDFDHKIKFAYINQSLPEIDLVKLPLEKVKDPFTAFYISQILKREGKQYLSWSVKAVAMAPFNQDFMFHLAKAYEDNGNEMKAVEWYEKVIFANPHHKSALLNLGYIKMISGNLNEALRLIEEAIKADPNYTLAQENRINILLQKGEMKGALKYLESLIKKYPGNQKYLELRRRVLEAL